MNFKKILASSLVFTTLVGSIGLPNYVMNQDVLASTISIDYRADSAGVDGIKAFVTRMYDVCLGRKPDDQGLNGWTNQLVNKEATGCSVAFGFVFSPEFVGKNPSNRDFVNYMYAAFFGREADQGGLDYWVDFLNRGASKEEVFAGFANSQEFANLCKKFGVVKGYYVKGQDVNKTAKVNLFVDRLYSIILNRECDEGGMAGWTEKLLNREQTGCSVAFGFVFSPEFLNRHACNSCYVEALYKAFLGRSSDEGGKKAWVDKLNQGSTRESVFAGFAGSVEFAAICADYGIEPGNINSISGATYADGEKCTICNGSSNGGSTNGGNNPTGGTNPTTAPATPTPTKNPTTSTPTPTSAPVTSDKDGLVEIDGDLYYYERGKVCHGFVQVKDDSGNVCTYYFDDTTGKAFKGWHEIEGKKYYFLDSGIIAEGFCKIGNNTYYFNPVYGVMRTGFLYLDDETYFFDRETGIMQIGWQDIKYDQDEKVYVYYFLPSGKAATGFQTIDGKKYHFSDGGILNTGWIYAGENYNVTYYANDKGVIQTGWVEIKNKYTSNNEKFYFDSEGIMLTDWQKIDNKWYHFKSSGVMETGWILYNGADYYLGTDGIMQTGWVETTRNGKTATYYFITSSDNKPEDEGKLAKGWVKVNNKDWYYFNSGIKLIGWRKIDGKYYWFGDDGINKTGWQKCNDDYGNKFWSYFTSDGAATGWKKLNDKWYYFTIEQGVMVTGERKIDNVYYYFYTKEDESRYTGASEGAMASNVTINGYTYGSNGKRTN